MLYATPHAPTTVGGTPRANLERQAWQRRPDPVSAEPSFGRGTGAGKYKVDVHNLASQRALIWPTYHVVSVPAIMSVHGTRENGPNMHTIVVPGTLAHAANRAFPDRWSWWVCWGRSSETVAGQSA
jgi:hypothetical protein